MKPEIKKLWVDALRSGKYLQGKDSLRPSSKTFCCLGVLCDLHRKKAKRKDINWNVDRFIDNGEELPKKTCNWAGLEKSNPTIYFENNSTTLAELNDIENLSFKDIALVIEHYL